MTCGACNRAFACAWGVGMAWLNIERGANEGRDAPSRSMSYSCAILRMSSPSLASTVLSRLPLESLKWTLILGRNAGEG